MQKKFHASHISTIIEGSPPLRHLARRVDDPGTLDYWIIDISCDDPLGSHAKALLLSLRNKDSIKQLNFVLDTLETYRSRTPDLRMKISPLIEQHLTPLYISVECLQQLRIAACHVSMAQRLDQLEADPFIVEPEKCFVGVEPPNDWYGGKEVKWEKLVAPQLGNPSDGKFYYPDEDSTSKSIVEARRKAERNLDKYWTHVDNGLRRMTGYAQHGTVQRIYEECGLMRRTAPWLESSRRQTIFPGSSYEFRPFLEVFHDATKQVTGRFDRMAIANKVKDKTRGNATRSDDPSIEETQQPDAAPEKPSFRVDKASYTVFRTLFHSQNDGELPRNIRWAEVVSALTKLGFSAEKLHGSAWQFTSTKLGLYRGIQFHEPHPDDEVPLALARRYERRLNRAYGWDESMFKRK